MKSPIFVRSLTRDERAALEAGLHAGDAVVLRRCPLLPASAREATVAEIATALRCNRHTVRNAIHACNHAGVAALTPGSSRPHHRHAAVPAAQADALRDRLHRRPPAFHPTSLWTLALAAQEAHRQGLTPLPVSGETVRATLARLGGRWRRANGWSTSPDPAAARKTAGATD